MTPATLARNMWTTRRGVGLLITAMMLAITALLYVILLNIDHRPQVVNYGSAVYAPDRVAYCAGEAMAYDVQVTVRPDNLPTILYVVEAWRRDADGVTLQTTSTSYELPLVRPVDIKRTARRTVPDLPPGVYWLDHVSRNGETTGYTVGPVKIVPCGAGVAP